MFFLLTQKGMNDVGVREKSIKSLIDSQVLAFIQLIWTQASWITLIVSNRKIWIAVFPVMDLAQFLIRLRLRLLIDRHGVGDRTTAWIVVTNLSRVAVIAASVVASLVTPSEVATSFGIIIGVGYCGYIASLSAVFPILATVELFMMCVAMMVGFAFGSNEATRLFAVLVPIGVAAFWILMQRTFGLVMDAYRLQIASHHASRHDELTDLPNRAALRERLGGEAAVVFSSETVTVLAIDLDGFKGINDRYGHASGDWLLRHVATILQASIRPVDFVARIGGDEFVVVLEDTSSSEAEAISYRIIEALSMPFRLGSSEPLRIGASIGLASSLRSKLAIDDIIAEADGALYAAKRDGKGRLRAAGDNVVNLRSDTAC